MLAAVLGLSAGFAPGPLLALVVSETLSNNMSEGVKVAIAPVITDLPIILIAIALLDRVSQSMMLLALISFGGAVFVARLGIANLRAKGVVFSEQPVRSRSFSRGVITNLLSPHPYLFWLTVGVPIMIKASEQSFLLVIIFLLIFYVLLVGSKIFLALLVDRSRAFLQGKVYIMTMRILGLLLLAFSISLFRDGVSLLLQ